MTKRELAEMLVNSPAWDGMKSVDDLCKNYSKAELQDAYDMLETAEEEYFDDLYS